MAKAGIMHFAEAGGGLTVGLTGQIVGAAMTVGAIANHLQQNRQQDKDKDKRPPKERPLIIERKKTPRDITKEEQYNNCVAHETEVFNQDVEKVTAAADKHFEESEGPWWLGIIETLLEGPDWPKPGGSKADEMNQTVRTKEIEEGTKEAAGRRDERIQKNCKKP